MNNNYEELEQLCETFDKGYADIEGFVAHWGNSDKQTRTVMDEILRSGPEGIATDSELYSALLYLFAQFFQDPKAIKQLMTQHANELTPEGYQVLSFWQKTPGFWCYFSVKEELEDDFWLIEDHMTGEMHTLYSHGITTMQEWEGADYMHYLCMMLPNGECLQTIGHIKYNHIPVSDFLYYCSLFKPQVGLKAILHKHFRIFCKLDSIAHMPPIKHDIYDMGFGWQPFTLPEFDIAKLGGKWTAWSSDSLDKYFINEFDPSMDRLPNRTLFEIASPAMAASIVRDPNTGEMGLGTNTEVAYPFYAELLNRAYPELKLPKKPSVFVSAALRALSGRSELPFPWKKFKDILDYSEEPEWDDSIDYTKGTWKRVDGKDDFGGDGHGR